MVNCLIGIATFGMAKIGTIITVTIAPIGTGIGTEIKEVTIIAALLGLGRVVGPTEATQHGEDRADPAAIIVANGRSCRSSEVSEWEHRNPGEVLSTAVVPERRLGKEPTGMCCADILLTSSPPPARPR